MILNPGNFLFDEDVISLGNFHFHVVRATYDLGCMFTTLPICFCICFPPTLCYSLYFLPISQQS